MKIVTRLTQTQSIRKLSSAEKKAGQNVFTQCLAVKPSESVLIVTDPEKLKKEAAIFFETAKEFTKNIKLVSFSGMTENAQEPPKTVADQMAAADVALLVTCLSLSHTKARKNANKKGARIASMPDITQDMILRTLNINYSKIASLSKKLSKILDKAKLVTITSPEGTNLTLDITNRPGQADTGIIVSPGKVSNLPAGEGFIAPLETKTNGIAVFDGALADIKLDKPIKVEFKNGVAVKITGGKAAKKLNLALDQVGLKARTIAELGIGTNKACKLSPNILEAEKVYGTCHLALGNNSTFGGITNIPFHSDGIILNPTLKVDGKTILKDNKIVI